MPEKIDPSANSLVPAESRPLTQYSSGIVGRGVALAENLLAPKPIRVLIVDDILDTLDHLCGFLVGQSDIEVVGLARNGVEAIEQYDALLPDVMTTCINMPVMDGFTAIAEIRRRHSDPKVIILSVQGGEDYRRRAVSLGVNAYLEKPISGEEFRNSIREVANGAIHPSALVWDFESLKKYHSDSGMNIDGLIQTLGKLNAIIGDKTYELRITPFLRRDLPSKIESIWHLEIEPYLDDLDAHLHKQGMLRNFHWRNVREQIIERPVRPGDR